MVLYRNMNTRREQFQNQKLPLCRKVIPLCDDGKCRCETEPESVLDIIRDFLPIF